MSPTSRQSGGAPGRKGVHSRRVARWTCPTQGAGAPIPDPRGPTMSRPRTIDEVLAEARGRLQRLTPEQAEEARADGALVVDIRPAAQRAAEGELPFVTVIERNVLEWRL